MKKFLENKPRMWFMICLCLVFVLLIVFIIFMFSGKPAKKVGADVVATVGDYEITIEEYKDFAFGVNRMGTPEKPLINEEVASKDQLLQLLAEKEIIEAEAKKLNISVTEEELNTAIAAQETDFDKYENGKQEVKDYISYVLLQDKMADYLTGEKEGQFIVAREDIHYKEGNQYTVAEKSKIE